MKLIVQVKSFKQIGGESSKIRLGSCPGGRINNPRTSRDPIKGGLDPVVAVGRFALVDVHFAHLCIDIIQLTLPPPQKQF